MCILCFRLVQICKPFIYHRIYTHKKTIGYCMSLWFWAILLDLPNWLGWGGHTFALKEMGCTFDRVANYNYTIFLTTMSIFLPMAVVLACYLAIILFVRHSRREIRKFGDGSSKVLSVKNGGPKRKSGYKKDDLQFAFILFISFLVFVLCWSPYMIALIFDFKDEWPKQVYVAGTMLGHTNSCLNPIIYALGYARFRKGYYVFVHKLFCIKMSRNSAFYNDSQSTFRYKSKFTRSPSTTPTTERIVRITDLSSLTPTATPSRKKHVLDSSDTTLRRAVSTSQPLNTNHGSPSITPRNHETKSRNSDIASSKNDITLTNYETTSQNQATTP